MNEFGGPESFTPGEGGAAASEQVSEQAKEQFRQAAAQSKQSAKEEKKARKRDDRVAQTIRQFLSDDRYAHLFQLISRLAARDCPSVFILALVSLINDDAKAAVEEYIAERNIILEMPKNPESLQDSSDGLNASMRSELVLWISRLSLVMSTDTERILGKLMVDEGNIDGTVLQLTTFVLVDYFEHHDRSADYEKLQPLTIKILQDVIEPHMETMETYFAKIREEKQSSDEEDDE